MERVVQGVGMGFWEKAKGWLGGDKPVSPDETELLAYRKNGADTAIVFVHGFGGSATNTWGIFPELVAGDPRLKDWDIFNLGYSTGLAPDILRRIWSGDPSIKELSGFLISQALSPTLGGYDALVLVAHSMGGLVTQRALLDSGGLKNRVRHVFLFGTPSGGLAKASLARKWKAQLEDMADDGDFIGKLRQDWDQLPDEPGFCLWLVAGDKDEFVPDDSSLGPFPTADAGTQCVPGSRIQKRVVAGNHLEIVKPSQEGTGRLSADIVIEGVVGGAAAGGPANAARVAVAQGEFQKVIDDWGGHPDELDQAALVDLALAYEVLGQPEEAMRILETRPELSTDAMGVLGGRYKRRWLIGRRQEDGDRALELYRSAYDRAVKDENDVDAYYLGVNVAFMHLAFTKNQQEVDRMARNALDHAGESPENMWRLATQGEALLYLGKEDEALTAYRAAVAKGPDPRQMESMYSQAGAIAGYLDDEGLAAGIEAIFRPGEAATVSSG